MNLRENLAHKLKLDNWFHLTSLPNLHIFNVDTKANGNLSIRNTIHINIELIVKVYAGNDDIIFTVKLNQWSQLQSLIEQLECKVKRESDTFDLGVIDERCQSDDVKDDHGCGIDRQGEAVAFDFCARNDVDVDVRAVKQGQTYLEVHLSSFFLSVIGLTATTDRDRRSFDRQNGTGNQRKSPIEWILRLY